MTAQAWAEETFGNAQLGDVRRTRRLVSMARRAALAPAGLVTEVFRVAAERQAAYDLLEHDNVSAEALSESLFRATAHSCRAQKRVFVLLDGASVGITDRLGMKGFGRTGTWAEGGLGLKVMNALAVNEHGTPLGVADQIWWRRPVDVRIGKSKKYRPAKERESYRWREAVERVAGRFATEAPNARLHFIADREAETTLMIQTLLRSGHEFTLRSNATRKVQGRHQRLRLRSVLAQQPPVARVKVEIPETARHPSRQAVLDVRAARVPLVLRDRYYCERKVVELTVIWARERGHRGSKIDWTLITNVDVKSAADACEAIRRYARRWRIEDFHRTWKSGLCNVEATQLRSPSAVIKWATILAAVASRAERLRHLYRETPHAPASAEFSSTEIEAIVLLKSEDSRRERITAEGLTIVKAIRWIAHLGGYVGNRGSGPPGATTIARGLERVDQASSLLAKLQSIGRLR
ncbi:MAG: IS4 family transposase [Deltaproteobacteria bacterium]|nr:IS4 family transposase [Kofleriaceae bacterium]